MKLTIFAFIALILISCSGGIKTDIVIVVDVYQAECTNETIQWRTLILLDDGSRVIVKGRWGSSGDTLWGMVLTHCISGPSELITSKLKE
jgi:hypothetical protein